MHHISTKSTIMVADVALDFKEVSRKPYFASEYLEDLKQATLLLLPSEQIREGLGPVFPEVTSEFFRYLKEHASEKGVIADIAVNDENYHCLLLYSHAAALPTMLIKDEVLEQTADLAVSFLSELAQKNHRFEDEMDTFVNIIVEGSGTCRKIMFSGRVSELKESLDLAINKVFHEV